MIECFNGKNIEISAAALQSPAKIMLRQIIYLIYSVFIQCKILFLLYFVLLLLARLMGQYCFARWRLLSLSVVVYDAAGGRADKRVGGRASHTARRASTVTSRYGDTLFWIISLQINIPIKL